MYQKHASMCRISAVVKNAPIDLASGISWSSWRLMMRTARTIRSSFTSLIILTIFIVRRSSVLSAIFSLLKPQSAMYWIGKPETRSIRNQLLKYFVRITFASTTFMPRSSWKAVNICRTRSTKK